MPIGSNARNTHDIDTPINNSEGMEAFASAANELLDRQRPGLHNQAMMEFGALLCTPQNPDCLHCPVQAHCLAFDHQTVMQRPVKLPKVKISTRHFNYLVLRVEKNGEKCLYLHKRDGNDIWKNLYDFTLKDLPYFFFHLRWIENRPLVR